MKDAENCNKAFKEARLSARWKRGGTKEKNLMFFLKTKKNQVVRVLGNERHNAMLLDV